MLEKPLIPDEEILAGLSAAFGTNVDRLEFLPIGADIHTAVYRARGPGGEDVFVKLRTGNFDPASVEVPRFLYDLGITVVMAPMATRSGTLFHTHGNYRLMAYPFVPGKNGYEISLSNNQWECFFNRAAADPPAGAAGPAAEIGQARDLWRFLPAAPGELPGQSRCGPGHR